MTDVISVRIPQITDNDSTVLVVELKATEGQRIDEGSLLAVLETSKAAEEFLAPASGFVRHLDLEPGQNYSTGHLACYLTPQANSPLPQAEHTINPATLSKTSAPASEQSVTVSATPRALHLANTFGIDLSKLKRQHVRSADLIPYLISDSERRRFLDLIKRDEAFSQLESNLKVLLYRNAGFDVGSDVVIEKGAVLAAPEIHIADNVRIGARTRIFCDESLSIGQGTTIGPDGDLECVHLSIGSQVRIMEKVKMDLAGGGNNESRIDIEDRCLVSAMCYINGCRPVQMKERSAMSPRSMIFTHRFWQNIFDGYDAAFGEVTMGRNSWLGAGAQLLPGVALGEGAQVMSGSLVAQPIAAFSLAGGIPAQIVRQCLRKSLPVERKREILHQQMERFLEHLAAKQCLVEMVGVALAKVTGISGAVYNLAWSDHPISQQEGLVVIGFDLDECGIPAVDLGGSRILGPACRMTDELRDFFRRRGVDFTPHDWVYNRSQPL